MNNKNFKKILILIIGFTLFNPFKDHAATCTATVTGDWSNAATWSCGAIPACGDSIIIPAAFTVSVTVNLNYSGCAAPPEITIFGVLIFMNGKKMDLPCGSRIYIYAGGMVTANNLGAGANSQIKICGVAVWDASSGILTGPNCLPPSDAFCVKWLPIELIYFDAKINDNAVELKWGTATEKDNDHYEIERSSNAFIFNKIDNISSKAPLGTSFTQLNYSYSDHNPLGNISYYRVKQVDRDKSFSYTNIVSVNFIKANNIKFVIYPNPNSGEFTVDVSGLENNHPVEITLRDQNGRSVYHSTFNLNDESSLKTKIVPEEKLANGVYICTLRIQEIEYNVKVIVN